MSTATSNQHDPLGAIRQVFLSECAEGLDIIEAGLLALENGDDTAETINDIFRGAHSIKGGAATFGYQEIADFTHLLETLLDRLRGGELVVSPELIRLFLAAVDSLREMLDRLDEGDFDRERVAGLRAELEGWVARGAANHAAPRAPEPALGAASGTAQADSALWRIRFTPKPGFLRTGNQPVHLFRALASLGALKLHPRLDRLPGFDALQPEDMHLAWDLELETEVARADIIEVFDWVEDECEIEITPPAAPAAPVSPATAQGPGAAAQERKGPRKESGSIRVGIDKIDVLLNLVGEMVINQSMLSQSVRKGEAANRLAVEQGLSLLERTTRELQEAVMDIRMLPVNVTFSRFPRLVHDLSAKLGKKVELEITGEQTELDKTVLERIGDPLLHLVRNSLDHGIETPEARRAAGKGEVGLVQLSASHEGGSVIIRVSDDGAGLDTARIRRKAVEKGLITADAPLNEAQINDLIFHPGFSTADTITDVSGRGVGMDVVRSNIESIGGRVEAQSERGKGCTFKISLPLTLAILDGQLVRVGEQVYVIPLLSILETVQLRLDKLNFLSAHEAVYRLRGAAVPVIDLRRICRLGDEAPVADEKVGPERYENKQLVVIEYERRALGLVVDSLLDQHQVVIKSLEKNFVKVPGMLGATILGDGTVSLILDISSIAQMLSQDRSRSLLARHHGAEGGKHDVRH